MVEQHSSSSSGGGRSRIMRINETIAVAMYDVFSRTMTRTILAGTGRHKVEQTQQMTTGPEACSKKESMAIVLHAVNKIFFSNRRSFP